MWDVSCLGTLRYSGEQTGLALSNLHWGPAQLSISHERGSVLFLFCLFLIIMMKLLQLNTVSANMVPSEEPRNRGGGEEHFPLAP